MYIAGVDQTARQSEWLASGLGHLAASGIAGRPGDRAGAAQPARRRCAG